jgi:hypothetical protein
MATSEDEGATASQGAKPNEAQQSAQILPFTKVGHKSPTSAAPQPTTSAPTDQTEVNVPVSVGTFEFTMLDVFVLGMLTGGLLAYVALSLWAR